MITTCAKCGEALIAPDWSEFVSERLVLNLWTCTDCGDRFETKAYSLLRHALASCLYKRSNIRGRCRPWVNFGKTLVIVLPHRRKLPKYSN